MTRLLCRLFGHRWGKWHIVQWEDDEGGSWQSFGSYRECQRCSEIEGEL